jgi:hypothetical protein
MAQLFIRIAGALGITALALVFVEFIPFLASPAASIAAKAPSFTVNREFKGDRLPAPAAPVASQNGLQNGLGAQEQSQKPRRIPIGCEGSFSPISSPRLAHIVGRCMT